MGNSATVQITREFKLQGMGGPFGVFINGKKVETLWGGETKSISVESFTDHVVEVKGIFVSIVGESSKSVSLNLKPDEVAHLTCRTSFGRPILDLVSVSNLQSHETKNIVLPTRIQCPNCGGYKVTTIKESDALDWLLFIAGFFTFFITWILNKMIERPIKEYICDICNYNWRDPQQRYNAQLENTAITSEQDSGAVSAEVKSLVDIIIKTDEEDTAGTAMGNLLIRNLNAAEKDYVVMTSSRMLMGSIEWKKGLARELISLMRK